jgi:TRAP transporter TAXI family solute receptor
MVARIILCAAALLGAVASAGTAASQDMRFFRIGTGGTGGTYYPVGGMIAHAISNPPGSRPCDQGGSCGVAGLVAIAQSAHGSVANVDAIKSGQLESAFAQSDVAYWAYTGTGIYDADGRVDNLRAIASLYPESIHLVARKGSGITSVKDLKDKRVSLDEPGSGTLVDARIILAAYGLSERDVEADYIKPTPAIGKIKDDLLDAFIIVAGYPTGSVAELCATAGCELVPIDGPEAAKIREQYEFFAEDVIPADTYQGIGKTKTLSVAALWVVGAEVDEALVYEITRALWNDSTRRLLDRGHAKGRSVTLKSALDGVGIPLHPGAERFYREVGLIQ